MRFFFVNSLIGMVCEASTLANKKFKEESLGPYRKNVKILLSIFDEAYLRPASFWLPNETESDLNPYELVTDCN
jgi:hypothetical protein